MKRRVIIETPFAARHPMQAALHQLYLHRAMRDSLLRGEAPFASHLLYTVALNDRDMDERSLGMEAGFAWAELADATVVYMDLGISDGMQEGIDRATFAGRPVEFRKLDHAPGTGDH